MHGAIGVVGVCLSLTLGVGVMVCDRFQMPRPLVFFPQGVIEADIARPRMGFVGVGHHVCHRKMADGRSQVFGRPRTAAQTVRPMGRVGCLDHEAIQTGDGFMPCFRHHKRIGYAKHMLPLRLGQTEG
jgi:hypothetical protein